jgi:hypothetical protein
VTQRGRCWIIARQFFSGEHAAPMSDDAEHAQPKKLSTVEAAGSNEWPAHFPTGCPPKDADELSGTVYLLVATDPPTPQDMECAIDRNSFVGHSQCERASLSCARDTEQLHSLRKNVKRLRRYLIAKGLLKSEHGMIKQTGSAGHYSMWLRTNALIVGHTLFKVQP